MLPKTRYAKSGNVHVAYQVFGSGDIDLVFFPGFVSNIEVYWEEPHFARWLRRLPVLRALSRSTNAVRACRTASTSFPQWMNVWMTRER
jgi:hypothetical protein